MAACIVRRQVTKSQIGRVLWRMMSGGSLSNSREEDVWLRERREVQNGLHWVYLKVCSKHGTFSHWNIILHRKGIYRSCLYLQDTFEG